MAADLRAFIQVASNANVFFNNTSEYDLIVYPTSNTQKILIGNTSNTTAGITITSNAVCLASNVGIGRSNPAYTLDVAGDVNFTGTMRQNGTAFQTSRWTSNASGVFIMSNVGIGTSTLTERLNVAGKAYASTQVLADSNTTSNAPGFSFLQDSNTGMYLASNDTLGFVTGGGERMRIHSNGSTQIVGPTALTLAHPTPVNGDAANNAPLPLLRLVRDGTLSVSWPVFAEFQLGRYDTSGTDAKSVLFLRMMNGQGTVADSTPLTIRANGAIGIGTTTPAYALDVASTTKTTQMLVGAGGPGFTGLNGSNTNSLVLSGAQAATGAHIYTYSQDAWPNFQLGNWSHTNVSLGFDVYFDGNWRNSTSTTPGYVIYKTGDLLCFYISPKVASAGATTTLTPIMCMSNTNVGIGTTTPNAALQLSNVLANRRIVLWEGANNDHQYYGFGVNNGIFRYQIDATTAQHAFYAATSASTSTEIMRIQGNGNVGIGTTSPSATLHVNGNTTINGKLYNESLLYAPPSIGVSGGTGDKYVLSLGTASEYPYSIGIDAGTMWYSTPANTMQRFFIGGAERFRIQTSNISVTAHVIPTSNEVFDLGTSNMRFRDLYLSGNTIFMGSNYTIGTDSNTDTLTLLDRRTNLPIKLRTSEVVLSGSNNQQKVLRLDNATGNIRFFNRYASTGVEIEEGASGTTAMLPRIFSAAARTSPADNEFIVPCWSKERGIFVAVSQTGTGNRVITSPDGVTWTTRTSAADNGWHGVCWSPERGLFVAVSWSGTGNRVMTSPDGITWTARTSAADNSWHSVCWSPERSLFVAVAGTGTGNRVMTSPDGITWTARTSAADNSWLSVCWSAERGLFAVVANTGIGNRVMTSPDGITWTARTSAADNSWHGVCWSAERGLFVAVANTGTNNRVMTSPDGITWTARASAADIQWTSVCWSPQRGLFLAVADSGTGNRIMTSPDGYTWTSRSSAADNAWRGVCWSAELGIFVAVSYNGSGNRVMTMQFEPEANLMPITLRGAVTNASFVATARTSAADNNWYGVCWSPERSIFVAVAMSGTGNRVMTSPDGITWTARTSAADNNWISVCWSKERGLFVAVAGTGTGNRVMTSPDGITWTARTSAADNQWRSVCWSPERGLFVAVADSGTGNRVMTSPDGITWTARTSAADNGWWSVCWSAERGLFVAVALSGTGNRVMTSPDGITWTARTSAANNGWLSVCWSAERGLFVAVAESGTGNRAMTSPDGITWIARASAIDNSWHSVCWSSERGIFLAVSYTGTGNRIMTSPDGINWTARSSPADNQWASVCWSPQLGIFAAVALTGTGNRVMTMQANQMAFAEAMTVGDTTGSGVLSVGLSNPAERLHVAGKIRSEIQFLNNSTANAAVPCYSFAADSNTGMYSAAADALGFVTGGTEKVRIDSAGNVMIGNTSTSVTGRLSASTGANTGGGTNNIFFTNADGGVRVVVHDNHSTGGVYRDLISTAKSHAFNVGLNVEKSILTLTSDNTGESRVISLSGSVGIGTTSPAYALDVATTARTPQMLVGTGGPGFSGLNGPITNGLVMSGAQSSTLGAHIHLYSQDAWPNLQLLNWSHNNISLAFDAYADGTNWRNSTSTTPGYSIYKVEDRLDFYHFAKVASAGAVSTFTRIMCLSNTNVGIGTTTPVAPLHITANASLDPDKNGLYVFNPNNSANQHAFVTIRTAGAAGGNPMLSLDISAVAGWSMGIDRSDNNKLKISQSWSTVNFNTRMTFDTSGNVGIGTTTPSAQLHVAGSTLFSGTIIGNPSTGGVHIGQYAANRPGIELVGSEDGIIDFTPPGVDSRGRVYYNHGTNYMTLNTNNAERIRIDSAGNVGIGTSSPSTKLHVVGSFFMTPAVATSPTFIDIQNTFNSATVRFLAGVDGVGFSGTAGQGSIATWSAHPLVFFTNGVERLRMLSTGNIGIGTTTPAYNLDVNGTILARSGNTNIGSTSNQILFSYNNTALHTHAIKTRHNGGANDTGNAIDFYVWQTSDATSAVGTKQVMSVTSAGVGISTTTPAYRLDVSGTARASQLLIGTSTDTVNTRFISALDSGMANGDARLISFGKANSAINQAELIYWHVGDGNSANRLAFGFNSLQIMHLTANGNVGIGTASPTHPLHVATQVGNVSIQANFDIVAFSDRRLKEDLMPITDALAKINNITGYTYKRKDNDANKRVAGVVAQEVKEVLPEVVYEDESGTMSVAYGNMSALLIEAIKELKRENEALKHDYIMLKQELENIKSFIRMP